VYEGTVKSTTAFGAFVEIMPGTEGLVHISELQHGRTEKTEDVVKRGDRVKVKLVDRDERGRIRLSMKALVPRPEGMPEETERPRGDRPPRSDRGDRGDRGGRPPRDGSNGGEGAGNGGERSMAAEAGAGEAEAPAGESGGSERRPRRGGGGRGRPRE
jgi:polyribonucleotide nucleotidyltransferase